MEMHIFSRKKERIRSHFISLLNSIKSQSPSATDLCIHSQLCRIDKKCNEIKQKQKTPQKNHGEFDNIFTSILYTVHNHAIFSTQLKYHSPLVYSTPPSLSGFVPVVFTFFCHYRHRASTYTFTFYVLHGMYFIRDGV